MPTLQLHPAIVHLPLGLALVVPLAAAAAAAAAWRGRHGRRALAALVALQAAVVVGGHVAARMGREDKRIFEDRVGIGLVEEHERLAGTFLLTATAVLIGAVASWAAPPRTTTAVAAAMLAGSLIVAALAIRTGQAGGALAARYRATVALRLDGAPPAARPD